MACHLTSAAAIRDSGPTSQCSSYDPIADEYYDASHITSRNFDAATRGYFAQSPLCLPDHGLALDLGAGRGRLAEYCGVVPARIVQVDISPRMLNNNIREPSLARILADAHALPFRAGVFAVVAAFLFDPFNSRDILSEVARVIRPGGVFLGTLPHHSWGLALRSARNMSPRETVFVLKSGEHITRRSCLSDPEQLVKDLNRAGLRVLTNKDLTLPENVMNISRDIELPARMLGESAYRIPIVQLVVAEKV